MTDLYEYGQTTHDSQLLLPADVVASDAFGWSCAVDGDVMVIGTPWQNSGAGAQSGAAYVFENVAGTWTQVAKLTNNIAFSRYGYSVAISGDTIVVGAPQETTTVIYEGAVHVYRKVAGTWGFEQKLVSATPHDTGGLGWAVAIDGDIIAAGGEGGMSGNSGWAYAFHRTGSTWGASKNLAGVGQSGNDIYGRAVAISGTTIVVGSITDDSGATDSGSAYVFDYDGAAWSQTVKIAGAQNSGYFGSAVAIDGDLLAVASYGDNTPTYFAGTVHVYELVGGTWTFRHECYVARFQSTSDEFGQYHGSLAVVGDTVVVGAGAVDIGAANAGMVIAFLPDPDWATGYKHWFALPAAIAGNEYFGQALAYDGTTLIVAAPRYSASDTGAAYVFGPEQLTSAAGDTTPPTVTVVSPPEGTPLRPTDTVVFDVDDDGGPTALRHIEVRAPQGDAVETIWDGTGFVGPYTSSSRVETATGYRFTVQRNGGWIQALALEVDAIDTSGNKAI